MSEILKVFLDANSAPTETTWWLILDCGHWYHWSGLFAPKGTHLACPSCNKPIAVTGLDSDV